ncbi:site-specific integrase [Bacillus paralicheniformis]|uniref:site-specific integrase n=1 Tax=Bacillus paralicheniformis TaxID=1648923 RepID=UPI0022431948|nr:site-specific integrase [Bacillus paralicheniformis]MEC1021740.1 site-specific integrase [Bacillus paralicheniformis]MEC1028671.1 site-specific integrase [Bacillus paralicheniformis]MEC1032956.1 site-specific integrase [Bacillus paralicheniformis]MEC1052020.1 site-specific integrase [Bacillus paralicheniformis]MEC1061347.1 site-specific integrase [Bacillus paralicheniformis]
MATFRKRGDKWEYRVSFKDPFTLKYKIKSKSGFKTKKEAQKAAAEQEKLIASGLEFDNTPLTLEQFLMSWLQEYKKGTVRKNTYQLHERNIKNHILPYFKNAKVTDVKPIMYQKFLNHLTDQGYSKRTVEIIHGTMFNAFNKAVIIGKLEKNPCYGATIANKKKKKKESLEYMISDDIPRFLQEAYRYNYIYYIFFRTLIETGMRKGEAAALQWSDINLRDNYIDIKKTLDFSAKTDEELFGDPKTYDSKRRISIGPSLSSALQKHKKWQFENKQILQKEYKHDLNLVFCRVDGDILPKSTLFNAFNRILKRANIERMPIHALRHTHAVLLLESGADMKYIQERLGHKSMMVTADVYSHISKKLDQNRIKDYEDYVSAIMELD